ncbi:MAG: hypothetical protein Q8M35_01030 [Pseudohongiella sp.]|nr:hypothetical protein [Pseudohongiella sp.]
MSNTRSGSILNEFMLAARDMSVFSAFTRRVIRFSLLDALDPAVKFSPRFFLLIPQGLQSRHVPVELVRAWILFFGTFLFIRCGTNGLSRTLFVSTSNTQIAILRTCLNRLRSDVSLEKPTLSVYFWRMNVLR